MSLTVLSVAYPLAPVGSDAAGGSEQVLRMLDRAMVARGIRSIVIACAGSRVDGMLLPIGRGDTSLTDAEIRAAHARLHAAIAHALASWRIDIIHMHGADWHDYLPPPGPPVLATLHLPPSWYPQEAFAPRRPDTFLNCVSRTQHEACPPSTALLPPIENGIDVDEFCQSRVRKRGFTLILGRICPEKGVHLAIAAARRADVPLIIAGELFPYPVHQRYFDEHIAPELDQTCRYIGPVGLSRKRRLLGMASCVLVPSVVPETSSLVAREAAACGTPVIAFRNGALNETIVHGRTGFLVDDTPKMAEAIARAHEIDPDLCRARAREHFDAGGMIQRYLDLYYQLAGEREHLSGAA